MSKKIEDGKTAKQRYESKLQQIMFRTDPKIARDIRDSAALQGLSIAKYLIKCHEFFQNK